MAKLTSAQREAVEFLGCNGPLLALRYGGSCGGGSGYGTITVGGMHRAAVATGTARTLQSRGLAVITDGQLTITDKGREALHDV